ncbi:nuclear autoantigen Sp-100-like isoform 2-T2 [Thomomys bottae]
MLSLSFPGRVPSLPAAHARLPAVGAAAADPGRTRDGPRGPPSPARPRPREGPGGTMAGEDRDHRVWTRMDENKVKETLFRHYKIYKVEISKAITKPFPFLESLRDRELITNKMYEDCYDSYRNLVPIHNIMYNVLRKLEKILDIEVLGALFSPVNMQEYPELTQVHQSFVDVVNKTLNIQEGNREETDERPNHHLRSLQGSTHLENGLAEGHSGTRHTDGKQTNSTHDQSDGSDCQEATKQQAQESPSAESDEQEKILMEQSDAGLLSPSPLALDEESRYLP